MHLQALQSAINLCGKLGTTFTARFAGLTEFCARNFLAVEATGFLAILYY